MIQATEAQDTWEEVVIVVPTVALIADAGHQEEEEVDSITILGTTRITNLLPLDLNAMKRAERKTLQNERRTHSS